MTRRGDFITVIRKNDYGIAVGEKLLVKSGADSDGQILVWLPSGDTAVFNWNEYRIAKQTT